jgi:hypothetical protein
MVIWSFLASTTPCDAQVSLAKSFATLDLGWVDSEYNSSACVGLARVLIHLSAQEMRQDFTAWAGESFWHQPNRLLFLESHAPR